MGINFKKTRRKITMAQPFNSLDANTKDQMACTFAALLCHDQGLEVNSANLAKVCKAAGLTVAPYWPMLFANALDGRDMSDFMAVSGGGSGPVQAVAAGGQEAVAAPKEEAKKEEEEEEEDMDLGDL